MNYKVVPNAVSAVLLPGYVDLKFSESIFLVFISLLHSLSVNSTTLA